MKDCLICKKSFRVKPYMLKKAKFCSQKCFGIYYSQPAERRWYGPK